VKTVKQADADTFTAIAHPVRRQLLDLLVAEDHSVTELAANFKDEISRPAISQHLKVLLDVGLVTEERQGRERIYRLQPTPLQAVDGWLETYRRLWNTRLDRLDTYLRELQAKETKDE
jgi:DNA-binding transcriptional ArsR family regulator